MNGATLTAAMHKMRDLEELSKSQAEEIKKLKEQKKDLQYVISLYRDILGGISIDVAKMNRRRKIGYTDADMNTFFFCLNKYMHDNFQNMAETRLTLRGKHGDSFFDWRI